MSGPSCAHRLSFVGQKRTDLKVGHCNSTDGPACGRQAAAGKPHCRP